MKNNKQGEKYKITNLEKALWKAKKNSEIFHVSEKNNDFENKVMAEIQLQKGKKSSVSLLELLGVQSWRALPVAASFLIFLSSVTFFGTSQEEDWVSLMMGSNHFLEWTIIGEGADS